MDIDRQAIERRDFPICRPGTTRRPWMPTCARSRWRSTSSAPSRSARRRAITGIERGHAGADHPRPRPRRLRPTSSARRSRPPRRHARRPTAMIGDPRDGPRAGSLARGGRRAGGRGAARAGIDDGWRGRRAASERARRRRAAGRRPGRGSGEHGRALRRRLSPRRRGVLAGAERRRRRNGPGAAASTQSETQLPPAVASSAFAPPTPATATAAAAKPQPQPSSVQAPSAPSGAAASAGTNGDLDSARLVALNMALNGESREDADRYLAEHFKLTDRQKLIDEVYAAIEG